MGAPDLPDPPASPASEEFASRTIAIASATNGEPAGDGVPVADGAPEVAAGIGTRNEEHLYLHLQRFSFCVDRVRARFAGPGDAGGDEEDARLLQEIASLDAYLADRYPEPSLPLSRLRRRFGLDDLSVHLLVAAAAPGLDLSLGRRLAETTGRSQPAAGFLVDA